MKRSALALVALSALTCGCATFTFDEARVTAERTTRSYDDPERESRPPVVHLETIGTTTTVTAAEGCASQLRQVDEVETTRTREKRWKDAGKEWTVGAVLGVASLSTAVVLLVDAKDVSPNSSTSRVYNPVGPDAARGIGYAFAGAGLIALAIPTIDSIRSIGSVEEVSVSERRTDHVRSFPCKGSPLAGATLTVRANDDSSPVNAAVTGTDGKAAFDLLATDATADLVVRVGRTGKLKVRLQSRDHNAEAQDIGDIRVAAAYDALAGRAWDNVPPLSGCTDSDDLPCQALERFVRRFPDDAAHCEQVRPVLQSAREHAAARARERAQAEKREREAAEARQAAQEAAQRKQQSMAQERARQAAQCRAGCARGCAGKGNACVNQCVQSMCR